MMISRALSDVIQPVSFAFSSPLRGDALTAAKNVDRVLNVTFEDSKLLCFNGQDITHVHVTYHVPSVLAEIGLLRKFAVSALHFDDAAALGQLRIVVAFLGNISFGP